MKRQIKHFDKIINEMCRRVNAKPEVLNIKNYKTLYSWTENEADDFIIWLTIYFQNHKAARAIFGKQYYDLHSRKICSVLAYLFFKNYGWEIK